MMGFREWLPRRREEQAQADEAMGRLLASTPSASRLATPTP